MVRVTYQEYLNLPEDQRYEILEGELHMVPAPNEAHQRILTNLAGLILPFITERNPGRVYLPPFDVILAEDTIVQPDLLIILNEHRDRLSSDGLRGAPDLVVEILSPSNASRDRGTKRQLYGRYGVQEYWIIDPFTETVEIAGLRDGRLETVATVPHEGSVRSLLFPELILPASRIFAR